MTDQTGQAGVTGKGLEPYTRYFENLPLATIITDPDLSIRWVNSAFEKLTGFALADINGSRAPYPWWPESRHPEYLDELNVVRSGKRHKTDWEFQNRSGETFW